jgi:hypothetical protein
MRALDATVDPFRTVSPRTPLNKGLATLPLGVPVTIAAEVAISG